MKRTRLRKKLMSYIDTRQELIKWPSSLCNWAIISASEAKKTKIVEDGEHPMSSPLNENEMTVTKTVLK